MFGRVFRGFTASVLIAAQAMFAVPVPVFGENPTRIPYVFRDSPSGEYGLGKITADTIRKAFEENERRKTKILFRPAPPRSPSANASAVITAAGGTVRLGDAQIYIPPGALEKDTVISITRLRTTEDTGDDMRNATYGGGGYRFEPAGTKFLIPATIKMGYDPDLTESAKESLYTYFYDTAERRWESLERAGIEDGYVVSLTDHFTDMINGTLSLPEGPAPLRFNINSIKGLEAADPSAGIGGIEGLEANNTGSAGFRIPIEIPPGRAGMNPGVAVTYSSDGGNGIMGRGFDLQAGGRITTDTRFGSPRFNGKNRREADPIMELLRDTYLLDGVKLEIDLDTLENDTLVYRPLREGRFDRIERRVSENGKACDYWVVTDKTGTARTYGKSDGFWSGKGGNDIFTWELEEERDVFGNTVRYVYSGGNAQLFLEEIVYTGNVADAAADAAVAGKKYGRTESYSIVFEYSHDRPDVRVDGRGGFAARTDRLLKGIKVNRVNFGVIEPIREYGMKYGRNFFGASQMTVFGQLAAPGGEGEYFWSYGFGYVEPENEGELFGPIMVWENLDRGLQAQTGTSAGGLGSVSGGAGVGLPFVDGRGSAGFTFSWNVGTSETFQTFIDMNGDGRPDSVVFENGRVRVQLNGGINSDGTGGRFGDLKTASGGSPSGIGRDKNHSVTTGIRAGAGAGFLIVGLDYSKTVTNQSGGTSTEVTFADVDGDGLADIIVSGSSHYYRNNSYGDDVSFERVKLPISPGFAMPPDVETAIDEKKAEQLDRDYFHQTPFREWRAPEIGGIRIDQRAESVSGAPSSDGIRARTYYRGETGYPEITLGASPKGASSETREIGAGESVYFVGDAGLDTVGDTIDWDVTITYEKMRYFGDIDGRIRSFIPENYHRIDVTDPKQVFPEKMYEPGYERGPHDGSTITHYKHIPDRQWADCYGGESVQTRRATWEGLVERGWFVPGIVGEGHFERLWNAAVAADSPGGDRYRGALVKYYVFDAGTGTYVRSPRFGAVPDDDPSYWSGVESGVNRVIRDAGSSDPTLYAKLAGYPFDSGDRKTETIPIPAKDGKMTFFGFEGHDTVIGRVKNEAGYVYVRDGKKRLTVDVIDGKVYGVDVDPKIEFGNAKINERKPFDGKSAVTYYINDEPKGTASVSVSGGKTVLTLRAENEGTRLYDLIYEFSDYRRLAPVIDGEDVQNMLSYLGRYDAQDMPYYRDNGEGKYVLEDGFADAPFTDAALARLYDDDRAAYEAVTELYALSAEIGLVHYTGALKREIRYYSGGLHDVKDGGAAVPVLETTEDGRARYTVKNIRSRRTEWNSSSDFAAVYAEPKFSYNAAAPVAAAEKLDEWLGDMDADKKEKITDAIAEGGTAFPEETEVTFQKTGILQGGKNGWYYGVWIGSQEKGRNPFSEERLYALSKTDPDKAKGNMKYPKADAIPLNHMPVMNYIQALESVSIPGNERKKLVESETGHDASADTFVSGVSPLADVEGGTGEQTYFAYVSGSRIHTSRAGGRSYYELVSLYKPAERNAGAMPTVRKSENSGTDTADTWTLGIQKPSMGGATAYETFKNDLDKLNGIADNINANSPITSGSFSSSVNKNDSEMVQSVQGMGGNGFADIVQLVGDTIVVTEGSRAGFVEGYEIRDISKINYNESETKTYGASLGVNGASGFIRDGRGGLRGIFTNGGGMGASYSTGDNSQTAGFVDLNGDGLPDYLEKGETRLNLGRGNFDGGALRHDAVKISSGPAIALGTSISPVLKDTGDVSKSSQIDANFSAGGSFNYSSSIVDTDYMLVDMNGDGLPDVVEKTGGGIRVKYNLGDAFAGGTETGGTETDGTEAGVRRYSNRGWDMNWLGSMINFGKTDGNLAYNIFKETPIVGDAAELLGLDSLFSFGNQINLLAAPMWDHLDSLETNFSISLGLNVTGNFGMKYTFSLFFTTLNVNIGAGAGVNMNANIGNVTTRLMDIDGDGLPDRVLRVPVSDRLYVRLNTSGKTGLLNRITHPQGGETEITYGLEYGTTDMPQSRYVMTEVKRRDTSRTEASADGTEGEKEYVVRYGYEGGYYHRGEKEFLGFAKTTAYAADCERVTVYGNREYHSKGMPEKTVIYDGKGRPLRETEYAIDSAPYARNLSETRRESEGEGAPVTVSRSSYVYDREGNVIELVEEAYGSETVTAKIDYRIYGDLHVTKPERIRVYGEKSGLLRVREGSFDAKGNMTALRQMKNEYRDADDGISALSWDAYGNLTRITDPNGAYVDYTYDDSKLFVEKIKSGGKDAPVYVSFIEWDKVLGRKKSETDENGHKIEYVYDPYGRLKEVWSPYDRGGKVPSVSYRYEKGANGTLYAVTENKTSFDREDAETLTTVTVSDSLGRALYTAKRGEIWENGAGRTGWNVTGLTAYDAKGRAFAQGQPQFAPVEDADELALTWYAGHVALKNPTIQKYDALDRTVRTELPSENPRGRPTWTTDYFMENGARKTVTTDPLKNASAQITDGRGNVVKTYRYGKDGGDRLAQAEYVYNGIGEMLLAKDAEGNPLEISYDRLGRRTKMKSGDIGVREWEYDRAGNMTTERDSELAKQGRQIRYVYDGMNRLVKIDYPFGADTTYEYGGPDAGNNAAGRVRKIIDETGSTEYTYGMLGQIETETREITLLPLSRGQTRKAVTGYESDYLGRMRKIVYPDGETVTYDYNKGGGIYAVRGERQGVPFDYVKKTGYDVFAQRVYIEYGNGTRTSYEYDPYTRRLSSVSTEDRAGNRIQEIKYDFDDVGNVNSYVDSAFRHTTTQKYEYDSLYQLVKVEGTSAYRPYGGGVEYEAEYAQNYRFDKTGNMRGKVSKGRVSNDARIGDDLNYDLAYSYYEGTHKAERIGNRYYKYDLNGNLVAERDGGHATETATYRPYYNDGDVYWTDYGFGVVRPELTGGEDGVYQRNYKWNERNLLSESSDSSYTVQYRYGADGQRAIKYVLNTGKSTLYFNRMWQTNDTREAPVQSKHIYMGETRIATKNSATDNPNTLDEERRIYYYHSDHLGSARTVTNYKGDVHERLEYTPYGELWIDWKSSTDGDKTPFRFTGKERDEETGLYYYGARYLDPRTSRWLTTDPAMYQGDYIPSAPVNDEARKRNGNLPGQGGIYNTVNMHVYHYAGNNPVKYTDPDGRIINKPALLYRQSDSPYSGVWLGGTPSYDDADGTIPNTIGDYGCLYMAAVSVGLSIRTNNGKPSGMRSNPGLRSMNDLKNAFNPLAQNVPGNYLFTPNDKNGTDVILDEPNVKKIIENISGKKIERCVVTGNFTTVLKYLDSSKLEFYVIAKFKTGPNPWNIHFNLIDGITENSDGTTSINYREQYNPYVNAKKRFDKVDLEALIVIYAHD